VTVQTQRHIRQPRRHGAIYTASIEREMRAVRDRFKASIKSSLSEKRQHDSIQDVTDLKIDVFDWDKRIYIPRYFIGAAHPN